MHIAYIVPSLLNAGMVNIVHDLVEFMLQHGYECIIYYFDNKKAQHFLCKTQRISMLEHSDINKYDVVESTWFTSKLLSLAA